MHVCLLDPYAVYSYEGIRIAPETSKFKLLYVAARLKETQLKVDRTFIPQMCITYAWMLPGYVDDGWDL